MTINVGLVTNDALVFGCDSIASVEAYYRPEVNMPRKIVKDSGKVRDQQRRRAKELNKA